MQDTRAPARKQTEGKKDDGSMEKQLVKGIHSLPAIA